jgi:outer membrane protein insertion porin family
MIRSMPARSALSVSLLVLLIASPAATQELGPLPPPAGPAAPPAPHRVLPRHPNRLRPAHTARRSAAVNSGDIIQAIRVEGNRRIEPGTIESYMLLAPGDPFDRDRMDRSLKTLFATGLFSDVRLRREGNTLVVQVVENPIVNRVAFEGNHAIKDDTLREQVQLRPRAVYTPIQAEADRKRLLDFYASRGRYAVTVQPQIIRLPDNRVDVIYDIHEGPATYISRIVFVGNHAFSQSTLADVITSRETTWWNFFTSADTYNPERVKYDIEQLRRFYLRNGYVDFEVVSANAELSPDRRSFILTFTLHEGERYRIGKITIASKLRHVTPQMLMPDLTVATGEYYNGDAVEKSVQAISTDLQNRGYAFVEVKPRIARNPATHTVDLVFDVTQGPRVYVERIDIVGNTRTEDKVIRREFRLAEGDAFNAEAIRQTRQRLQDLGYFNTVNITTAPGSAPDRAIITTTVEEKPTGELTLGGGYSTDSGALVNAGIRERNFLGSGVDAGVSGVLAQLMSQIDLSLTDPYFLDRNIVAGIDIFDIYNDNQYFAQYSEERYGLTLRAGYQISDHLRQSWTYSLVNRDVTQIAEFASYYIYHSAGWSLLSQIGQTFSIDYRDSTVDPHTGFVLRLGVDYAGLGGQADFVRTKLDGQYLIPLDFITGNSLWGISLTGGIGRLFDEGGRPNIVDNFYLGGDNLRGFLDGGVGPHDPITADALGGRIIWTQSTELRYPLPVPPDLGLSGRAFVDLGGLQDFGPLAAGHPVISNDGALRMGAGIGFSWKSPFGLINLDFADAVLKQKYDKTQFFRIGFGTRF